MQKIDSIKNKIFLSLYSKCHKCRILGYHEQWPNFYKISIYRNLSETNLETFFLFCNRKKKLLLPKPKIKSVSINFFVFIFQKIDSTKNQIFLCILITNNVAWRWLKKLVIHWNRKVLCTTFLFFSLSVVKHKNSHDYFFVFQYPILSLI